MFRSKVTNVKDKKIPLFKIPNPKQKPKPNENHNDKTQDYTPSTYRK